MITIILGLLYVVTFFCAVVLPLAFAVVKPVGRDIPTSSYGIAAFAGLAALALFVTACHKDDAR